MIFTFQDKRRRYVTFHPNNLRPNGPWEGPESTSCDFKCMFRPALRQFSNIWLPGGYLSLISNRIRKNMPPAFSPGFGRSPNPGLAGDSKPRGGSVKPGSGGLASAWAVCCWLAGGQLSKAGGGGGFLARTPSPQLDLSF